MGTVPIARNPSNASRVLFGFHVPDFRSPRFPDGHSGLYSSKARVSLADVFHPWVRWERPGSGFENSSGGGVWKSRIHRFGPLGIEVEKQGFRTVRLITGQKFP